MQVGTYPTKLIINWYKMTESSSTETLKNVAIGATVGAAVGGVAVAGAFLAVGLTFGGPIAGGWFAANMGAALVAGSPMAMLQSAAMTTGAYYTGAGVGGVIGAAIGTNYAATGKKDDPQEQTDPAEPFDGQLGEDEKEDEKDSKEK